MIERRDNLVKRYDRDSRRLMLVTAVILGLVVASNIGLGLLILDGVEKNQALSEEIKRQGSHLSDVQDNAKAAAEHAVRLAEEEVEAQERARINADIQVQAIKDAIRCLRRTRTLRGFDRCIANLPPLNLVGRPTSRPTPRPTPQPSPKPSPSSEPSPTPSSSPCQALVPGICRP